MSSKLEQLEELEAQTRALRLALEREREALKGRQFDALLDLVAEKHAAVAKIEALFANLRAAGGSQVAEERWERICRLAVECRELNEANGAAIALLQEHNRQALALLLERKPLGYGPDGRIHTETGGKPLAEF